MVQPIRHMSGLGNIQNWRTGALSINECEFDWIGHKQEVESKMTEREIYLPIIYLSMLINLQTSKLFSKLSNEAMSSQHLKLALIKLDFQVKN